MEDLKELLRNRLTEDERRYLAMHARYASKREEDFRYWHADPVQRERLRLRWREIADMLEDDEGAAPARRLEERIAAAVSKATANPGAIVEAES